jgi:hypothetical protein
MGNLAIQFATTVIWCRLLPGDIQMAILFMFVPLMRRMRVIVPDTIYNLIGVMVVPLVMGVERSVLRKILSVYVSR